MKQHMIKILIADDHNLMREGLVQILKEEFKTAEIGEAINVKELLKKATASPWDIIICDLSMPGRGGLEALKQLKENCPEIPVLILTMCAEDEYAIRVLKAGAHGFLSKENSSGELVKAIHHIMNGKKYISAAIGEKLAENIDPDFICPLHELLSDREFDVLKMIDSGKTISQIAEILSVSPTTVSTYRTRLLAKMHMKTNAELIHYVTSNNLSY